MRVETADNVAEVVLNRPHRRNAVTGPLVEQLSAALDRLAGDDSVAVVLLRGEGGTFCSGLDLKEFAAKPAPEWVGRFSVLWAELHGRLYRFPKPTVGALEGAAIAGGSALALSCDILVAGDAALFHISEAELGRPAPINTVWMTMRVGPGEALATLLTAPRLTGKQLVAMGLAHKCVPDEDVLSTARGVARRLAEFDAAALASIKAGVRALQGTVPFEQLVAAVVAGTPPG